MDRGRTIVYFDKSNIFQGQIQLGWRIGPEKLIHKLEGNGKIWQTHFFAAVTDPPRFAQTAFYKRLKEQLHWETHLFTLGSKTVWCKTCGTKRIQRTEKGVDVAIANQMLRHAYTRAFDTAILVSGDKDFLDTVRTIKNLGMRVEIISFRHSLSREMKNESSVAPVIIDDFRSEIEHNKMDPEISEFEGEEEMMHD